MAREGLIEDAKKNSTRKSFAAIPNMPLSHSDSRRFTETRTEAALFTGEETRRRYGQSDEDSEGQKSQKNPKKNDPDMMLRDLDRDLKLGIYSEIDPDRLAEPIQEFAQPENQAKLLEDLRTQLSQGSARDWMDVGIGFFEMELYSVSTALFLEAFRQASDVVIDSDELEVGAVRGEPDPSVGQDRISAMVLLAWSRRFAAVIFSKQYPEFNPFFMITI